MTAEVQADLVVPVEMIPELQLALLADLRSLGEQVLERTPILSLAFVDLDVRAYVQRLITRRELLETVGWPGQKPSHEAITLPGGSRPELALELLNTHRDHEHEHLARGEVPADERAEIARRVESLSEFLSCHCPATGTSTRSTPSDGDPRRDISREASW